MLQSTYSNLLQTFFYGCTLFDTETDTFVLDTAIGYILSAEIFKKPLF